MTDRPNLRDLVAAQLALLRARRRLRLEPIGNLTERRQRLSAQPSGDPTRAEQLARAVHVAAARGLFRPFCLVRALALESLLLEHGITGGDIRIGVRRQDGVFAAHAWLRWNGRILGDDPAHVATFTEVDDIRVLHGG